MGSMSPSEIIDACNDKGVLLRVNPTTGSLTATPRRKLSSEMLAIISQNRAAIIEFIEARDNIGEVEIVEAAPPEPPQPSMGEKIVTQARAVGVRIKLDYPSAQGMMRIETDWESRPLEVPDIAEEGMPRPEYVARQRKQVPSAMAAMINNYRDEILTFLRAPYMPAPLPPGVEPAPRSIWARIARPDDLIPNARDNQRRIRQLLYGEHVDDKRAAARSQQWENVMPLVLSAAQSAKGK